MEFNGSSGTFQQYVDHISDKFNVVNADDLVYCNIWCIFAILKIALMNTCT